MLERFGSIMQLSFQDVHYAHMLITLEILIQQAESVYL